MLDKADGKIGWYSTEDIEQIVYDLIEEGDVDEAMRACQIGLDQHPDDECLVLVEAKVLIHQHRIDEAERLIGKKESNADPFEVSVRFGIMAGKGNVKEAFSYLFGHLSSGVITRFEYVSIIEELFDALPHTQIAENLVKVAQLPDTSNKDPKDDLEALARIGGMLMDCNCHEEAIPILENALDQDAYDVFTWQDLARCQYTLKQMDKCAYSCEMGLAIDPNNPLLSYLLGFIRFDNKDFQGCIEPLTNVCSFAEGKLKHEDVGLDREQAELQFNLSLEMLSTAYSEIGDTDKSIACLQQLIDRMPKTDTNYVKLATLYMSIGDSPSALTQIEHAIALDPKQVEYKALRVAMLTDMHRFDEAMTGLDELIRLEPRSKAFLLAKAELAMSLKKFDEADKTYRRLLKLKPKDYASKEMMRIYFESIGDEEALKMID